MIPIAGYDFCKSFIAVHSPDGTQTNYQMKLTVIKGVGVSSAGTLYLDNKSTNWPYDIRFTKADGTSLLYFWREESDATDGTWWIKTDSIPDPADFTGYVHVGDADATDASDGTNTFLLYDHFSSYDAGVWQEYHFSGPGPSVASSILTVPQRTWVDAIATFAKPCAYRSLTRVYVPGGGAWQGIGLVNNVPSVTGMFTAPVAEYMLVSALDCRARTQQVGNTEAAFADFSGAYRIFDVLWTTDSAKFLIDGLSVATITTNVPTPVQRPSFFNHTQADSGVNMLTDWVLIRNYTLNEPMWGAWGDWESGTGIAPTVTTQVAINYTKNSCLANGNITDIGSANATRQGFAYKVGLSGDPTIADSIVYTDGDFGTGAFTKIITGLKPGFNYRIRAYATNAGGTGYGTTIQMLAAPHVSVHR